MFIGKIKKFFFLGAVIFIATYFLGGSKEEKVLFAGLIFLFLALLFLAVQRTKLFKEKRRQKY